MSKQRGDTIIEVLMAMAVIGITLGAAFGIANRSLAIGRGAQERTEALKIAESQLELVKQLYDTPLPISTKPDFCITKNSAGVYIAPDVSAFPPCANFENSLYNVRIDNVNVGTAPPVRGKLYKIEVTWTRIGANLSVPLEKVTLYYRTGK